MALEPGVKALGNELRVQATDWFGANPFLALALVLAVLVLLLGAWYAYRRYFRSTGKSFHRLLARQDSISILLHPNPDPDAMAAGLGVAYMAELSDTEVTIQFPGEIRHQENRAFRTILDLDLEVIESAEELESDDVVLVDHNEPRGFRNAGRVSPLAVVDHHPGHGTGTHFTDVRPGYGSCATIITEYLQSIGVEPARPDRETEEEKLLPTRVATGLLYGILSDTAHLTKGCSDAEFAAASFLYRGVDEEMLDRIANPQVDAEVLDVKAKAIDRREVKGPYAVSDIGEVSNVDAIPQAADELLKLEGVTAVVVGGTKDETLHLSGRSRDDRVHMGKALERAVEDIPQSGGGGHARMGGAQISMPHMNGLGPGSGISVEEFYERLFRAMAGEELPQSA